MRFIGNSGSFEKHRFGLEKNFEKQLYRFSKELFRGGMLVRWAPLLKCELTGEGVQPDCLLVNLEVDEWWVVEVELGGKSKISNMVDQLGKLSRVNYTKHVKDVSNGLKRMGLNPRTAQIKAQILCAENPRFMLIVDENQPEMINAAEERNFVPIIVHCYSNSDGEYRLCLPEEHALTKDPLPEGPPALTLRAPEQGVPRVSNGRWWLQISASSPVTNFGSINVDDGDGSFTGVVDKLGEDGEDIYLVLPIDRKSVLSIIKGNRVGSLIEENKDGHYHLQLGWE